MAKQRFVLDECNRR